MRHLLLTVAASALLAGSAFAADLPSTKAAPYLAVSDYSWTGVYIGAEIGADFLYTKGTFTPGYKSYQTNGLFGGLVGYNYQIGRTVIGVEGDFGSLVGSAHGLSGGLVETNSTYDANVRARLGYAIEPRALLYVAGGVAFGNVQTSYLTTRVPESVTSARTGWTAGVGLEYALFDHCIGRIEYRYTGLGSQTYLVPVDKVTASSNAVIVGAIYKFGPSAVAPVVAKY